MGKILDIVTIICAVFLIISMLVFEPSRYISFKYGWMKFFFIFMLILAVIISGMNLKGKLRSRNLELARKFYNQGLAFSMRGDLNAAISNYKMALNMAPDFAPAHNALGHAFFLRGNLSKSLKHFKKAVNLEPDDVNAREALERALREVNPDDFGVKDEGRRVYSNDKYGFSIRCPQGWRINTKLPPEMLVHFVDSKGGSINLMAGPTYGTQEPIEDLENLAIRNVHRLNGEIKSLKRIKVDNVEAVEAVYTALGLKTKKIGFVKDGIEYIITCSINPNLFGEYEPIFNECIQSFKFKKQDQKLITKKDDKKVESWWDPAYR